MTTPGALAVALAEVSAWGPFFAVDTHPAAAAPAPPWRPMRELLAEPRVLAGRVESVGAYLSAGAGRSVNARVAASVTQLGLVARLLSPALGCVVHSGLCPAMALEDLWWQPETGSLFPLSVGERSADSVAELIDGPVGELVGRFAMSERVLWGNVASAINGAATMITAARPDHAAAAAALVDTLLAGPPLRAASTRRPDGRFQRRSCCLIYQASPTRSRDALCGDCVLAAR